MRISTLCMISYLLIFGIILGSWGCASRNPQSNLVKPIDYKKIMAGQKAEMADEEAALKKVPQMSAEGYERSGDQYLSQGKIDMAFRQYFEAARLDPGQARLRFKMGRLFLEKGLDEEAIKEFQEILKGNSHYALAYEGLGRAYFHMRKYSEAEQNFQQAIHFAPELWQAHNFLGIVYDRQEQFDAAIVQYKAALALKPNLGILFNNLGMSLFLKGEFEKAAKAFAEALRMETSNGKIYNNLALALCRLGRYPEALEAFKGGGEDDASAYYNLGYVYMVEGKSEAAIELFQKAIEIKPAFYVPAYENMQKARAAMNTPQLK